MSSRRPDDTGLEWTHSQHTAVRSAVGRAVAAKSWRVLLIGATLAALVAGCDRLPPDCRVGDRDDQQMSTRVLFLERLNGCPIGGRN